MKKPKVKYYVLAYDNTFHAILDQPCCTKEEARMLWKGTPKIICKVVERTKQ